MERSVKHYCEQGFFNNSNNVNKEPKDLLDFFFIPVQNLKIQVTNTKHEAFTQE